MDTITIGDNFDGLYLTYDLTKTPGYGWIGLYVNGTATTINIDRGHLVNGEFIVDESNSVAPKTYFRQNLDSTYGDVQLWRVTPSNGRITQCNFCCNTGTSANNFTNQLQPCVERVGRLNYVNLPWGDTGTGVTHVRWGTQWLERDAVKCECLGTGNLNGVWSGCYNLQSLEEIEDWPVHKWNITGLQGTFSQCLSLKKLDLSKWDVSGWNVTSISNMCSYMFMLHEFDVSTWDTSNWHVTSISNAWSSCYSLKELDVSGWDAGNWAVTSMYQTWYNCYALERLPVENWDTSNWAVTRLDNTWQNCLSLQELDLSKWDVSGWSVTTLSTTWTACENLQVLDISTWDVSEWAVTTLSSTWSGCHSLRELPISNWDVSNWAVTTLANSFYGLYCIEELDLSKWDVSNWRVTSMASMFYTDYNLKKLDISTWDVSDWVVDNASYLFYLCRSLQELDLSDWDISNWPMTNSAAWNYWMRDFLSIQKLKVPSNWLKGGKGANVWSSSACYNLQNFNGMPATVDHSYSTTTRLTPQSVIAILNKLPSVSSAKTITLGQVNKLKVTASDIAVATQKGWTVA